MRGHTLLELLLVLTLMGATASSLAPTARRYLDRGSVVAAREAMVGLLAETRLRAMDAGEASLRISADSAVAAVTSTGPGGRRVDFGAEYGVRVVLSGGRATVDLEFDALGLGRMAGQTIRFSRGGAVAGVVVSSYGRVRRR